MKERFIIHDLGSGEHEAYEALNDVPAKHRWAFDHILKHDCGSISCGQTIYELRGTL